MIPRLCARESESSDIGDAWLWIVIILGAVVSSSRMTQGRCSTSATSSCRSFPRRPAVVSVCCAHMCRTCNIVHERRLFIARCTFVWYIRGFRSSANEHVSPAAIRRELVLGAIVSRQAAELRRTLHWSTCKHPRDSVRVHALGLRDLAYSVHPEAGRVRRSTPTGSRWWASGRLAFVTYGRVRITCCTGRSPVAADGRDSSSP